MSKITTYYKGDMFFQTKVGNHMVDIDVPAGMGGKDRGPMPPELFVASLGSCIGAFVAQYCHNNGINADDMTVDISFDKVDNPTRLTNLKATVNLPRADCSKRVKAIERVAMHCPVHMTIDKMDHLEIEILGEGECTLEDSES
ncbi:MAG: OsmC family protein [Anaerolineae bacterium]|nr:OsmC family protein [Anaerolineae bacterium]